ncbi:MULTISPECIES: Fe-S cluster assembly protein SufD [unclassified Bosea (in: a-proteobacteria)]|uniref:Fe-S cluster assembly protein SufD n=1 Tax=unclassified Bosea (in: a-proteobacteria) TaxID=2653178 RepID=UPI00095430AA|nr:MULTISPECIES: Fe-S cluster assembly protein SufD [unclassified Bosea (in: a-proteobacteria)]SIQ43508.1 Iron-regulated ABC transporter permease protein SufD [Bosea sp. TND4EK4]
MAIVTPLKTAAEQALVQQYADAKAELPGGPAVRKLREDAFAGFEAKGLPHRRLESWRYTDLRSLLREARPLADGVKVTDAVKARLASLKLDGLRLVLVDGVFAPELSMLDAIPEGLTVQSLADALVQPREDLARVLSGPSVGADDAGLALNTALMRDGVFVEVADGVALAQPVVIVSLASAEAERAAFHRSVVLAGKGAKATIVEVSEAAGPAAQQVNGAIVFETGDESDIQHVRMITRHQAASVEVQSLLVTVGAHAKFDSFALVCNAGTVRQQHFVRFAGEHTEIGLRGINLINKAQHSDVTLVVDHAVPHGTSRELYKTIAGGEATGVFQGKVVVRPHAQKTDGGMKSNALLLNEGAAMFNKPELEIFADDVVCGHGATVAQIDSEQLFYLMARGLPRAQAEALVLQAFAGEAAEFIGDEAIRELVMGEVEAWLKAREAAAEVSTV